MTLSKADLIALADSLLDKDCQAPNYNEHTTKVTDDFTFERDYDIFNIRENVLGTLGGTPMIKLDRFAKAHGLKCEVLAKCDFFCGGGSTKDRIGRRMIEEAEAQGKLQPGDIIFEGTSGNTGIGLAVTCAVKGYRLVVIMPRKMSMEKENLLVALGALVIRTRSSARWNDVDSHIALCYKMRDAVNAKSEEYGVKAVCLDQYMNPGNVNAHYHETAEEILKQTNRRLDMLVATVGTGGTITGVAERLKKELSQIIVVGVDPEGSLLSTRPKEAPDRFFGHAYEVEGIGYDFYPQVFHHDVIDIWVKSNDRDSLLRARELIKREGLLCGGSSGAAVCGVLEAAKDLDETKRVVVLLPDSVRNYMTKFLSDDWMLTKGIFKTVQEHNRYRPIDCSIKSLRSLRALKVMSTTKIEVALKLSIVNRSECCAVLDPDDMTLKCVFTREELNTALLQDKGQMPLAEICDFSKVYPFVNDGLTAERIGEAKVALLALGSCGVLTVVPDALIHQVQNVTSIVEKRALLAKVDFSTIHLEVITQLCFLKSTGQA